MNEIYEKLADKLDHLSVGFKAVDQSGADLAVLETIFNEEDAIYALELADDRYELPSELAARLGKSTEEVSAKLEDMVDRGLIFFRRDEEGKKYRFLPYVLGIMEFQINKGMISPDYKCFEYMPKIGMYVFSGMGHLMWANKSSIFHYIPVNSELVADNQILPRDDAMKVIDAKDPAHIALAPCACRQGSRLAGNPCVHSEFENTCMYFGDWADFFVERGDAHYTTPEHAKELLKKAEKEGLLIETINTQAASCECICMCCSCCCGPLQMLKGGIATNEAIHTSSNYYIEKDESKCTSCGACISRCPLDANSKVDDKVIHNPDYCVGCGLCVSTCPEKALSLHIKPADKINPCDSKDVFELHDRLQKEYRERTNTI